MSQLLLNRFHCGRPDKGFWIFIPSRQKLADSLLQVFHAAEGSTADSFGSEFLNHRSTRFNQLKLSAQSAGENEDVL